jgi:hypothetical protein
MIEVGPHVLQSAQWGKRIPRWSYLEFFNHHKAGIP